MELRWTEGAAEDLQHIAEYLFEHASARAVEQVGRIYNASQALLTFPHRGRPGRKAGTQELPLPPQPYVVVYTITGDVIHIIRILIIRILHGAQKWP